MMKFFESWTPKLLPCQPSRSSPGLKIKTEETPDAPKVSILSDATYSPTFNPDATYPTEAKWLLKMKIPEEITEHLATLLPEVTDQNLSEAELDPDAALKELHKLFLTEWLEEEAVSGLMEKAGIMERDNPEAWESLKTDAYWDKVKRSEKKTKHGIPEVEALELMWALEQIENEKLRRGMEGKGKLIEATEDDDDLEGDDNEIPDEE